MFSRIRLAVAIVLRSLRRVARLLGRPGTGPFLATG